MAFLFFDAFSKPCFPRFGYLLFFLTQSTLMYSTCYFPDGTPSGDIPCPNSSVDSYCCGIDSLCLENKVCLNNIGTFARGSCTDRTWNSSACPLFCMSDKGAGIVACPPLSSGTWCCNRATNCCLDSNQLLTLGQVTIISSKYSTSTASDYPSASTASESPVSISNSASAASASLDSTRTTVSSGTTIPISTPASSPGLSDSAKVGIGTGIPLSAIIVVLLAFLFYRNHQLRAKPPGYGAEGKHHLQEGLTTGYTQQAHVAEFELHQEPPELSSEPHQEPPELSSEPRSH